MKILLAVPYFRHSAPGGTPAVSSSQATLGHIDTSAYRCFLPDLTGFTEIDCPGPSRQHHLPAPGPTAEMPQRRSSILLQRVAGSRAPLPPHLARPRLILWRRERDSNPRDELTPSTRFPGERLQPNSAISPCFFWRRE